MTFNLDKCPLEISTRLFDVFLMYGETGLIKVLLRAFERKQDEILARTDVELQRYVVADLLCECIESLSMAALTE